MAHFAKIDSDNKVLCVEVVNNDVIDNAPLTENENIGINFLNNLYKTNDRWVQTSYGLKFRKNFASVGYTYDENRDAFIPPKPFNSWLLNENTCRWEAPIPYPNDGIPYIWNEEKLKWENFI